MGEKQESSPITDSGAKPVQIMGKQSLQILNYYFKPERPALTESFF